MKKKWIAVFGSGRIESDHPIYRTAYEVGELLAREGYGIVNGGYGGVMEAVAKGAQKENGAVRSVPCREFGRPNIHPYATEVIWTMTYEDRIRTLIQLSDGYIALPGGIGTLAEVFYAWSLAQVHREAPKPLVLYGHWWDDLMECFRTKLIGFESDKELILFTHSFETVLQWLEKHFKLHTGGRV